MPRPISIDDKTILDAARKVFLRHGYGATAAQVAREAGVSEGSLFKHFKTKNHLFLTALRVESVEMPWHDRLLKSVGTGDIRGLLVSAGQELLQRLQTIVPRMMMVQSSGMLSHRDGHCLQDVPPPVYHVRVLSRYFAAEIRRGRLAMRDPASHAHAFFGAISHYVFCETLFGYRPASSDAYIRTVVDTILRAAAPEGAGGHSAARLRPSRRCGGKRTLSNVSYA